MFTSFSDNTLPSTGGVCVGDGVSVGGAVVGGVDGVNVADGSGVVVGTSVAVERGVRLTIGASVAVGGVAASGVVQPAAISGARANAARMYGQRFIGNRLSWTRIWVRFMRGAYRFPTLSATQAKSYTFSLPVFKRLGFASFPCWPYTESSRTTRDFDFTQEPYR